MRILAKRGGYTLVEVLTATAITTLIAAGGLSMMISAMRCFDNTSVKTYTDSDAVIAMQKIVSDVREAKSVSIISGGSSLRVTFPIMTSDGYYDRHQTDTANQVDYYLSDSTGVSGRSGNWLWRCKINATPQIVKRDVVAVAFEQDTARSIKITLTAQNQAASGPKRTDLTQRIVYLRNY